MSPSEAEKARREEQEVFRLTYIARKKLDHFHLILSMKEDEDRREVRYKALRACTTKTFKALKVVNTVGAAQDIVWVAMFLMQELERPTLDAMELFRVRDEIVKSLEGR
jgi:ABC-type cobalamin/Fe3+-siderophores transport system ATPase subunit